MIRIIGKKNLEPAPFADEVHDMGNFVNGTPKYLVKM